MEILQTSVKKREGRKWKQRWVVLKRASLKLIPEVYHYLFIYKDSSHAKEGKEKYVLPLIDFCGLDISRHYDKEENILILVTTSQTVYLSFNQLSERDQWKKTLVDHFGEPITYEICIPDKQKLKAGKATIRLYQSFVSIITNSNYKCLNRWFMNDIQRYSAVDRSHFMFEIISSSKRKGGNVINLLVNDNAEDISKAFDSIISEAGSNITTLARHGSAMLDELDQAKRNVGDQNFFRRAILRYSERMKKKKRDRTNTEPTMKKRETNHNTDNSMQQQGKYRSLERNKNPQISIDIDSDSILRSIQLTQSKSTSSSNTSPLKEIPPELPTKRFNLSQESRAIVNETPVVNNNNDSIPDDSPNSSSFHTLDSTVTVASEETKNEDITCCETRENVDESNDESGVFDGMDMCTATDKCDLTVRNTRRSVDSFLNNNNSSSYKNPARYAIAKTKGVKNKDEQTPTPPPRSPVSLGLAPNVFQFPPAEESVDSSDSVERVENENIPDEPSRVSTYSNSPNDDVKTINDIEGDNMDGGISPEIRTSITSNSPFNDSNSTKDAYENLPNFQNMFDSSDFIINQRSRSHNTPRCDPDPLEFEAWSKATGDGRPAASPSDTIPHDADYVNVKCPLSDDDDSYVNVKRNKPTPLKFKGYQCNDFAKYDDEDSSIYHAFGALDNDPENNTSSYMNQVNGSYENVNGIRASPRNYLNVNKPDKLNYIDLNLGDTPYNKSSSMSSPFSLTPSYKTDYTRIDLDATDAIMKSMEQHRQQRDKSQIKTPTRTSR